MKQSSNSCDNLLCFQNCNQKKHEELQDKKLDYHIFQKLSLKKKRDQQKQFYRVQSHKKIIRPMPTTQRSNEECVQYKVHELQNLQEIKKKLENDLEMLDKNIDTYYSIYSKKLQQLKNLKNRMNSFEDIPNSKRNILLSPNFQKNQDLIRQNQSRKKLFFKQSEKTLSRY